MVALYHSSRLLVVGVISHSIAILSTVFRLVYRGWTCNFWWEDGWAAFALISDVFCLACIWIDHSISSWTLAVTFTSVLWAARMSVIFLIIRVTKHTVHRQITYIIAVSFACMWAVLVVQKLAICYFQSCKIGKSVALSQLVLFPAADVIADVALVVVPVHLWKNVGLSRGKKTLLLSAFGSSLLITVVTIAHSIVLIRPHTNGILIFAHVKAAVSLVICNLPVIVTFAYRVFCKETFDLDQSIVSHGLLTSIVMMQYPGTIAETLTSAHDGTFSNQMTTLQFEATKLKLEDKNVSHDEGVLTQ